MNILSTSALSPQASSGDRPFKASFRCAADSSRAIKGASRASTVYDVLDARVAVLILGFLHKCLTG